MNIVVKTLKHFHTVNKHRFYVFIYACKAGIPFRGLVHDLSKYSITEFWGSVKYFDGHRSPIYFARKDKGFSEVWVHHKGRNKHHFEYWEDVSAEGRYVTYIPYKYLVECICDKIAATRVYNGKNFNDRQPLDYWLKADKNSAIMIHEKTAKFVETILTTVATDGINKALKPKYLKRVYKEIEKDNNKK